MSTDKKDLNPTSSDKKSGKRPSLPASLMLGAIRAYQKGVSPTHYSCCRFSPTCSVYAVDAIRRFGALKGGLLALFRLLRCHPFSRGGYDPVPETFTLRHTRVGLSGKGKNSETAEANP